MICLRGHAACVEQNIQMADRPSEACLRKEANSLSRWKAPPVARRGFRASTRRPGENRPFGTLFASCRDIKLASSRYEFTVSEMHGYFVGKGAIGIFMAGHGDPKNQTWRGTR
jgi:hypothetical protein